MRLAVNQDDRADEYIDIKNIRSNANVAKSARILGQCYRRRNGLFYTLPPELVARIASCSGNSMRDSETDLKIAMIHQGKPTL